MDESWEHAAAPWAEHVRGGGDAPYEWNAPAFFELVPPPGRLTIDVGCGEGRVARELRARGHRVLGVDPSPTLVDLARAADPDGDYRVGSAEALPAGDAAADLVVSMNVLQHVAHLQQACDEAARVLESGGAFVMCVVHPISTAGSFADDDTFVLHDYCKTFERQFPIGEATVVHHHRPIAAYVDALNHAGLVVEMLREIPARRRAEGRIPLYLHVRGVKR